MILLRQGQQGFGEDHHAAGFYRNLPPAGAEGFASNTYNIANIQGSSQIPVCLFSQHIDFHVELNPAGRVAQIHERSFSHVTPAHDPACHRNLFAFILRFEIVYDLLSMLLRVKRGEFIRILPLVLKFLQLLSANTQNFAQVLFLFHLRFPNILFRHTIRSFRRSS